MYSKIQGALTEDKFREALKGKSVDWLMSKYMVTELFTAIEGKEQDVLTSELELKIDTTVDLTSLEDIYLPHKKKRRTKAETARKNGLEPLAKKIMSQRIDDLRYTASKFINETIVQ